MSKLLKTDVPFGMVPNSLLNDNRLSLKAKGLFAFMQSKPDGWNFSAKLIALQSKESVDAIGAGLKELELFGFLKRIKKQTSKGFITTYHLSFDFKNPILENPILENPILENPILENPIIGKSINKSNKDKSNKDISNKEEGETALDFLKNNFPSVFESLMMQFKSQINDWSYFVDLFEAKVQKEELRFEKNIISGRFKEFAIHWIRNQNKFDNKVIDLNADVNNKKEKIGGFV